jgi:sulfofructose kinase
MSDGAGASGGARVLAVGLAVLDKIFGVDEIPRDAIKVFATSYREIGGGPAATGAVTVARLGGQASLWTRVGGDAVGERIVAELREWGVAVTPGVQAAVGSNVSGVLVDRAGERLIVSFTDPALDPDPAWLPLDTMGADALLCDVRWPDGALAASRRARERGIPTVLDADLAPADVIGALLPFADHAVFSEPALTRFTGRSDRVSALEACRGLSAGTIGVTVGEEGYHWLDADGLHHEPGFRVQVVDTLGAGDVFHGAYALAIAEGRPTADAARFANAAAALKCTRPGGRAGIPLRREVEALSVR